MSVGEGITILLVICLVLSVFVSGYCLAKNEMLTEMYNDLVRRYNEERGVYGGDD